MATKSRDKRSWFDKLSKTAQIAYLRKHPDSIYSKTKKVKNLPVNKSIETIRKAHVKNIDYVDKSEVRKLTQQAKELKIRLDRAKSANLRNALLDKYDRIKRKRDTLRALYP